MLNFFVRCLLFFHKRTAFLRQSLLVSQFGFISQCRHSPTCSEYLVQQTQKNGWRGFFRGIRRLFTCF